jgi:hypothetical protein
MKQVDGPETRQKADQARQNHEPPIMLVGDTVENPEHFGCSAQSSPGRVEGPSFFDVKIVLTICQGG